MTFSAPLWLLSLLPWVGLVLWMFTGRRSQTRVPFLVLWDKNTSAPRPRAAVHMPPMAILCFLLATLLAILGASDPVLSALRSSDRTPVTIILDRGATMSAAGKWQAIVPELAAQISARYGDGPVTFVPVPDGKALEATRADWSTLALALDPTAADTRRAIHAAAAAALRWNDSPIFVISNQPLEHTDRRLIQVAPTSQPQNAGIASVAASRSLGPQVMVRVRNDSSLTRAELRVGSAAQTIELPPRGSDRTYFIAAPELRDSTPIELNMADDLPADNRGTLVLTHARPRLEPSGALPAAVQRIVASYTRTRAPASGSRPLRISTAPLDASIASVHVAPAAQPAPDGQLLLADHPINANLNWSELALKETRLAPPPAGDGWTPVVRAGDRPLVAVRQTGARQVWVGFESESFPRHPGFVVFWTNLLDWAGEGGEVFAYEGALAVPLPEAINPDWQTRLASLPPSLAGGRSIGVWLLLAAQALVFLGVLLASTCKNCAVG
jgi:hypothetical protein